MYKLFTDVDKNFQCQVDVDGVSLNECKARILVESDALNLVFMGTIQSNGICTVPIKRLKDILPEDTTGNIKLEVIADNTLFEAWNSDFVVKTSKKVTIKEVKDVEASITEAPSERKVSVSVKEVNGKPKPKVDKLKPHMAILQSEMKKLNINTLDKFNKMMETYKDITTKKGVLTENDIKVIQKRLIKKI